LVAKVPKLLQYRWLASTATPMGPLWPVAIVCGLLPSRFHLVIVPFGKSR
jgi:hypothetical protein